MAMRNIACLPALVGAFRDAAGGMFLSTGGNFSVDRAGAVTPGSFGRPHTAHHQHVDHRPGTAEHGRADRGAHRLQLQSGGGGAGFDSGGARLRTRRSVHGGARALSHRHRRLCGHRAAGDHAARAPRRGQALRPLLHGREQSGDRSRSARRNPTRKSSACWPRAMGFTDACFRDSDASHRASRRRRDWDFNAVRARGWKRIGPPKGTARFAEGGFDTPSGKVEFLSGPCRGTRSRSAAGLHCTARGHAKRSRAPLSRWR